MFDKIPEPATNCDMKKCFAVPHNTSVEHLVAQIGYRYHCGNDGRPCYHRQLNDPPFPRFHAYIVHSDQSIEIDLHFDALDSIDQKGNHDQPWAYKGGRIEAEMQRISDVLEGRPVPCVAGTEHLEKKSRQKRAPKNFIDALFG